MSYDIAIRPCDLDGKPIEWGGRSAGAIRLITGLRDYCRAHPHSVFRDLDSSRPAVSLPTIRPRGRRLMAALDVTGDELADMMKGKDRR